MKKHKVSAIIAFGMLALAVVVGAWAISSRDSTRDAAASPGSVNSATANPTSDGQGTRADKDAALDIPKKIVDPTSGKNYCATAKLLAVYAQQSYGLDRKLQIVDGKKFDTRLKVIAKTYARLAHQAASQPKAGEVAQSWQKLADATSAAERKLRASGLQAQSQEMLVQMSHLSKAMQENLPRATETLKAACGLSPEIFTP